MRPSEVIRALKIKGSLLFPPGALLSPRRDLYSPPAMMAATARVHLSSAEARPAMLARGVSEDEGVGRYILRDHGPRPDHRISADPHATQHDRAGSNRRSVIDKGLHNLPIGTHGSGVEVVREGHMWPDEYIITDGHAIVKCRAVLNLAIVADRDILVDVYTLAYATAPSHLCSLTNLGMMPHECSIANRSLGRHFRRGMNPRRHIMGKVDRGL